MTTEDDDPDGILFEMVREIVGSEVPIAATLDLHANVSERMVQSIDVFIGYRTNPHLDMRERGVVQTLRLHLVDEPEIHARRIRSGIAIGLLKQRPADWLKGGATGGPDETEIEARIAERLAARKAKDFATADRIRDELAAQGVLLEDGPKGTSWRRVG